MWFSYLLVGTSRGLFHSGLRTEMSCSFLISPIQVTYPALFLIDHSNIWCRVHVMSPLTVLMFVGVQLHLDAGSVLPYLNSLASRPLLCFCSYNSSRFLWETIIALPIWDVPVWAYFESGTQRSVSKPRCLGFVLSRVQKLRTASINTRPLCSMYTPQCRINAFSPQESTRRHHPQECHLHRPENLTSQYQTSHFLFHVPVSFN